MDIIINAINYNNTIDKSIMVYSLFVLLFKYKYAILFYKILITIIF